MTNALAVSSALVDEEAKAKESHIGKRSVARVIDYIQANPDGNISLEAMARMAGVSPNHFVALFTEATGLTPHQYVLRARIDRAKLLLKDEALTIAQVSKLTGFRTQEHFTKVFRKIVGITPSDFRSAT